MLSKNDIKLVQSLVQNKYRKKHGMFVAEGNKIIADLLSNGFELDKLFSCTPEVFSSHEVREVDQRQLKSVSLLSHPKDSLAIFKLSSELDLSKFDVRQWVVVCDRVQDPGNLGTIIRTMDWFGMKQLVLTEGCADPYNPKVVQATMGSLGRVKTVWAEPDEIWESQLNEMPVVVTTLNGESLYSAPLPDAGMLVMGNESKGVRTDFEERADLNVLIPKFGDAESLNVAISCSVMCSEIRRQYS